jgi:hypothetical protein
MSSEVLSSSFDVFMAIAAVPRMLYRLLAYTSESRRDRLETSS